MGNRRKTVNKYEEAAQFVRDKMDLITSEEGLVINMIELVIDAARHWEKTHESLKNRAACHNLIRYLCNGYDLDYDTARKVVNHVAPEVTE